jgi:hypothetical protein
VGTSGISEHTAIIFRCNLALASISVKPQYGPDGATGLRLTAFFGDFFMVDLSHRDFRLRSQPTTPAPIDARMIVDGSGTTGLSVGGGVYPEQLQLSPSQPPMQARARTETTTSFNTMDFMVYSS